MNETTQWAAYVPIITSSVALFTALLIFGLSELYRSRNAREERRRASAVRLLDAIDQLLRTQRRPAIAQMWASADLDVMLAQNRLLLDVDKEIELWVWLRARVNELVSDQPSRPKSEIAGEMSGAVTMWHAGRLKSKWFAEQNRKDGNTL